MFISATADMEHPPQRIVSLVPSLTELLFYLCLDKETVGITKFCVHPEEWFRTKTRIGGTKNVNIEKLASLLPDLVLCNKEENTAEDVNAIAEKFPVYLTDIKTFDDALQMIIAIGDLTGKNSAAKKLVADIQTAFAGIENLQGEKLRTAYLIWKDPYMTIGGDTFISSMMEKAGLENIYKDQTRYPQLTTRELATRHPQLVLLSSEPFPFKEKHITELQGSLPGTKILLADGEMFSWYGSRMSEAAGYFKGLIG